MEIQPQDYNIWAGSQTRNGFAADEIISSLQKAIRRAMEEQACQYAYELYVSGPIFLEKLWRRLLTISVEDIGFGNLNAAVYVNTMNEMRKISLMMMAISLCTSFMRSASCVPAIKTVPATS